MFKESLAVVDINNPSILWYPYVLSYETCEGTFQTEIYATSPSHAEMICAELKETAKIVGQKIGEADFG